MNTNSPSNLGQQLGALDMEGGLGHHDYMYEDVFDLDAELPEDFDLSEIAFQTVKHPPFSYYKKYLTVSGKVKDSCH